MVSSIEIVELWCGDCATDRAFEPIPVVDALSPHEWACTTCGAAYIEASEILTPVQTPVRGVA